MVKKSARRTRRTHSAAFKAQVALAALRDDKTMAELCKEFELHASQVIEWKRQSNCARAEREALAERSTVFLSVDAWLSCMLSSRRLSRRRIGN